MKKILQISLVILFSIIIQSTLSANLNEYIKTSELCTIIKKNNIHKLNKKCSKYLTEVQSFEVIKKKFDNMNNNEEKRKLFQIYAKELRNINAKIKPIGYSIDNYILSNYQTNNKQTLKNIDTIFSNNNYLASDYVIKKILDNNGGNLDLSPHGLEKIKLYTDRIAIQKAKEQKVKKALQKHQQEYKKRLAKKEKKVKRIKANKQHEIKKYNSKYGKKAIDVTSYCRDFVGYNRQSKREQTRYKKINKDSFNRCVKSEAKAKSILNKYPYDEIKGYCEHKGVMNDGYEWILRCVISQTKAKEYLNSYKHPRKNIMNFCKDKWGNNYSMVKSCYFDDDTDDKYTLSIASSEVKSRCKIKWGYDTKMFNYCVLQQQHSKASVKSTSNDEVRQQCEQKWGDNYKMAEYCIKEQYQAKRELQNYSSSTKNICEQKWGINYRMVLYCIRK